MEQLVKDWQNIEDVLHYKGLFYIPKMIQTELISRYYDNLLTSHFDIKKIQKFVAQKYY